MNGWLCNSFGGIVAFFATVSTHFIVAHATCMLFPLNPYFHSNPSLRRPILLGITPIELGNNMLLSINVGVACIRMDGHNSSSPHHPSPTSSATPLKRSKKSEYAAISARSFQSISLSYTMMIDIIGVIPILTWPARDFVAAGVHLWHVRRHG